MTDTGTIRGREAKDVVRDILRDRKTPKGLYQFNGRGWDLHLLIGSRTIVFKCGAGHTFYSLQSLTKELNRALDDLDKHMANRLQIDLEEAIQSAPA